jgi:hypothetical protein
MRLCLLSLLLIPAFASATPPAVTAVAYSPDGKLLAAGTRGVVHLIDPATGDVVGELPGQTQRVTALAVSKGGVLAVASGEPGKVGKLRLYLVTDPRKPPAKPFVDADAHKDSIYALAFSGDDNALATGSYDRTVKLWPLDKDRPTHTLSDHSDSVYAVAFSPDGKLLATGAADRAVKVWDTATGKRLYTLADSTDWVYAVAWSPDGKHLAAGGVDKSIRTWKADAEGGTLTHAAFAHQAAVTKLLFTADSKTLFSVGDDKVMKSWDVAKLTEKATLPAQPETILSAALRPDGKQLAVGRFDGVLELVDPTTGKAAFTPLPAKEKPKPRFPAIREPAASDSARTAAKVPLPVSVLGAIDRAGDVDYFRFDATAGQQVGIQLRPSDPKKLDAVLTISDADGKVVAESGNGLLGFVAPKAGTYAVGVADKEFRGGPGFDYTLNVGDIPVVTGVHPLGVQRGTSATVRVSGVHLGEPNGRTVTITVPATAEVGSRVPVSLPQVKGEPPLGVASVVVGEFPAVVATTDATEVAVPGTADGTLAKPGDSQTVRFKATKGQKLVVEVHAGRLGSPLDSAIEIQDADGRPLPRAVLRSVAQTYVTFRDHAADSSGIRLEAWNELRTNDYLYVDTELVRIKALPKNPDDDCQFVQAGGKRAGFLGTTPTSHAMNTPMYKVEIHPPGRTFPPNGLPVFPIAYRNDDGGEGFGTDSMLEFEAPADGTYLVKVADARGAGGPNHGYRLTVRPPRPAFELSVSPMNPAVWRNGGIPLTVTAKRIDGFQGPIAIKFDGLAAPFTAPATVIEAEQTTATVTLFATDAKAEKAGAFKAVGTATIADKPVTREASGGTPTVRDPGDLTTTTNLSEVTIKPGGETKLTVTIERLGDFKGRVPLDVRGLPHGVKVLNIGLNGILLQPGQTEREIVLSCEPWVQPAEVPIVVLSRSERKNSEHAAKSVRLKVAR